MIQLPMPILLELWSSGTREHQRARFSHETVSGTFPPGASVTVEIAPTSQHITHYIFSMTFGDLIDPDVVITHEHIYMMKRHEDPLIHSIVSQPYPLNLRATWATPHRATITNNSDASRDVEVTFWLVEMTDEADEETQMAFEGYMNLLTALSKVSPEEIADFIKGRTPVAPVR